MTLSPHLALHRFGFGARPGEAARLSDPSGWLAAQIAPSAPPAAFDGLPGPRETLQELLTAREAPQGSTARRDVAERVRQRAIGAIAARLSHAVATATPFAERLVWFWSNHLSIGAAGNLRVAAFAADYEQRAIRPHVFGRYADMLLASARHPAMLLYLNNAESIGPGSRAGRRGGRGLNENYARELLELHTVGVDGGYGQDDVVALAKALSGWTVSRRGQTDREDGFWFAGNRHEPGAKTILGETYAEGEAGGVEAIRALAAHPATARRLTRKLARHALAAEPGGALADRLAELWIETQGDLGLVTRALAAATTDLPSTPVAARQPVEYVVAAFRAAGTQLDPASAVRVLGGLRQLGQIPFAAPSPQGWPDDDAAWLGPGQVVERAEWALAFARRAGSSLDPAALAADVLGPLTRPATLQALARAASPAEGLALLLSSPEFMRR